MTKLADDSENQSTESAAKSVWPGRGYDG